MHAFKALLLSGAALGLVAVAPSSPAQISVQIGPEPGCPYGYFDYAPYNCAPDGYYGPTWFNGGVFIGAGPWFHGPAAFHGRVNNRFDPQHGYSGSLPDHGKPNGPMNFKGFKGNEQRDGRGHTK